MENSHAIHESIIVFRNVKPFTNEINEWVNNKPINNKDSYLEKFGNMIKRVRVKAYKSGDIKTSIKPIELKELARQMMELLK